MNAERSLLFTSDVMNISKKIDPNKFWDTEFWIYLIMELMRTWKLQN